jgi:hypothetical protein
MHATFKIVRHLWHAGFASKYEVYSGDCDVFGDHSSSPKIAGATGNALHVSFSIDSTAAFPAMVKLKKIDTTGAVKIEFDARE